MAEIVGIHGIAQEYDGRFGLEQIWLPSMRDGLAAAGHNAMAESLTGKHLRVAFFGDLFRPPGTMRAADYPYSPSDLKQGLELDLLTELYEAALAGDGRSVRERGTAEHAQAAMWLLSDAASFIIGVTVPVDGGYTLY